VHMQAEHLELYALGELSEDLAGMVESHLKECVACGIQFEESRTTIGQWVALDPPSLEWRKSPRMATDIGRFQGGVSSFSSPNELMRGMVVQLSVRDLFILAEVRYCRPAGTEFHAGVLIQDVFPAAG
jgi:hypothetical protein